MRAIIRIRAIIGLIGLVAVAFPATAGVAPVIDSFVASPANPVPGQIVTLTLNAHDPDCATTCTSGCGAYIRSELLVWSDDTGRGAGSFSGSTPSASGSPWSASVKWVAPPVDGAYTISAQVSDSGGMLCGGLKTTIARLTVTISSVRPPVIDSFEVTPTTVNAGGLAQLAATAHDPEGRPITYEFSASAGTVAQASAGAAVATWTAPKTAGNVVLTCRVTVPDAPAVMTQRTVAVTIGNWSGTIALPGWSATRVEPLPDGRIAVVDGQRGALLVIRRDGAVAWARSGLVDPAAVASAGNSIYVLERRAKRVSRWSLAGARLGWWPVSAVQPNDLAASPGGAELAMTDTGSTRVLILDPASGAVKRSFGGVELVRPTGVWFAADRIAVADGGRRKLLVFDLSGTLLSTLGDDTLFVRPQSVAYDHLDSTWLVSDSFSGEVQVIDQGGSARGQLAGFGTGASQVATPVDTAFLPSGREVAITATDGMIRFYALVTTLPLPQPASGVTAVDLAGDDGGAVTVAWSLSPEDPGRITGYFVERDSEGDGLFARLAQVVAGTTGFTDTNAGTLCHSYRVVATDGVLEATTPATACVAAKNDLPPVPPSSVAAVADSPTSVRIGWTASSSPDLAGYSVDLLWAGGARSLAFGPSASEARFDALPSGTGFTATVSAIDSAGNRSAGAQALARTWPDEGPVAPVSVAASDRRTGGTLDVAWAQPDSVIPVDHYVVRCTPSEPGWSALSLTVSNATTTSFAGLVNQLPYVVSITAVSPWGRESAVVSSAAVAPTAPPLELPVLDIAGRLEAAGLDQSAGVAVMVPFRQETRAVRFEYRTRGTVASIVWDGVGSGASLGDTGGAWVETALELPRASNGAAGVLWIRSASFPSPVAELAVRRVDLVPLAPAGVTASGYDTVVDVQWRWPEDRDDLSIRYERADGTLRGRPVTLGPRDAAWKLLDCRIPSTGVCRDAFLEANSAYVYGLAIVSPAGWASERVVVDGKTSSQRGVPPVTDLRVESVTDRSWQSEWKLDWTPLSFRPSGGSAAVAVPRYRIYRSDGVVLTPVAEVSGPVAYLPYETIRPGVESFVVRSVDDQGRESE